MQRRRWHAVALVFVIASAFTLGMAFDAEADGRRNRFRKLDGGERSRAVEHARGAARPALARRADRSAEAYYRSEVLLVERHRYAKGEEAARRLADVYVYDYDQDRVSAVVVDLDTDEVVKVDVVEGMQLPLTEREVDRALAMAIADETFGPRLLEDFRTVTGRDLGRAENLDVKGFVYRADSMRAETNRESRVCGKHRCAQLMIRTPEGIVLDLPIVDLSRGRLLDSREFGLNGRDRLRRRRALEDMGARPGAEAGGHHDHEGGAGDGR